MRGRKYHPFPTHHSRLFRLDREEKMQVLELLWILAMVFAFVGGGYYNRNDYWALGGFSFLWVAVLLVGLRVFFKF